MSIYEFKRLYEKKHKDYMFSDDTLKFFGESLSRMRVLKNKKIIKDCLGIEHNCYVVASVRTIYGFQRCKPYTHYIYFDDKTLTHIID